MNLFRLARRISLFLCLLVTVLCRPSSGDETPCLRQGDELWEVSSRCLPTLPRCTSLDSVKFQVNQFREGGWQASDEQQFHSSLTVNPTMQTVIYTHGNWMTTDNARGRAAIVYRRTSERSEQPLRFILYSWPSQREGRPVHDVYEKADRSNTDTFYFGHLLSRLPVETPTGILGFSFGARVVCGGLHLVNGGQLEGRQLPVWDPYRRVRIGLIAPAFDRTWLMPNKEYGQAMNSVDSLINIYNSRDPVLRRFRFLDRVSSPIAAGFTGLSDPRYTSPLQSDKRIRQFDCGSAVGTSHDELTYYRCCSAFNVVIDNVLGK